MSSPVAWSVQTQWPPAPRHVGDARRFVADRLDAADLGHLADTVSLIISELTTNAVRHARSPFRVTVTCSERELVIEVHDDSSAAVSVREGGAFDTNGRGLHLVSVLSRTWGVTPHVHGGKSVWATLDLDAPAFSV